MKVVESLRFLLLNAESEETPKSGKRRSRVEGPVAWFELGAALNTKYLERTEAGLVRE